MTVFEKGLLWASTIVVAISGVGFAITKHIMVNDDPFAAVNHPSQPYFLKTHVLAAPILVFAIGFVFANHVVRRWAAGDPAGRSSGGWLVAVCGPAVMTGYLLQVVASRPTLRWLGFVHLGTGLVFFTAILVHRVRSRVREPQDEAREIRDRTRVRA